MEIPLIDIHTHHISLPGVISIRNVALMEFHPESIPQATFFSVGIHPWDVDATAVDLQKMQELLVSAARHPGMLAIGEAGLDKAIDTPLEAQQQVFGMQVDLAAHLEKPMIIHCVRAFQEVLMIRKQKKVTLPWIMHGFSGSRQLAGQLNRAGCYLSFGEALLRNKPGAIDSLQHIGLGGFFLETDAGDFSIGQVYQRAGDVLGVSQHELQTAIYQSFKNIFYPPR